MRPVPEAAGTLSPLPRVVPGMARLLTLCSIVAALAACGTPQATVATANPSACGAAAAPPTLPFATAPESWAVADTVITVTNLEEARAIAEATDKAIVMVFAGSDWCAPCKVFKRTVLTEEAFLRGGKDDYVVVYLDYPSKKRNQLPEAQAAYNKAMAERYNEQGVFPRIYLLDAGGETIREMKFAGQTAEEFVGELAAARS